MIQQMQTQIDDGEEEWNIDKPLWSFKRLFFALGRWLWGYLIDGGHPKRTLLHRLRWHRRPFARYQWKQQHSTARHEH